jgi:D-glycero-beta-D-manno-heptose-7-phosphate kinase
MHKEEIIKLFESFNRLNVLIIGDVMVDSYLWGKVERISPEAPVPIVSVKSRENRLGGAANVALNIKALGANPILCSVIGNDQKGREFIELLEGQKMETSGIVVSNHRITTTKFRVIGNKMQMLRVDEEMDSPIEGSDQNALNNTLVRIIEDKKIDVIIFQDYDKGIISEELIKMVVDLANKKNIPIAVDPKKRNFKAYKGVTLFKPNLKELKDGLNIDFDQKDEYQLKNAIDKLNKLLNAEMILLTLSEDGVFIDYTLNGKKGSKILPSHVRSISDVSGAGDTVISVASLCLALKINPAAMAAISNLAGGLVCEKPGVVPVDKSQLLQETIAIS